MTAKEKLRSLWNLFNIGFKDIKHLDGKDIVLVVGNTGAGKSVFNNCLNGTVYVDDDKNKIKMKEGSTKEIFKVGDSFNSATFLPLGVERDNVY